LLVEEHDAADPEPDSSRLQPIRRAPLEGSLDQRDRVVEVEPGFIPKKLEGRAASRDAYGQWRIGGLDDLPGGSRDRKDEQTER
jgi:hypothetical protein